MFKFITNRPFWVNLLAAGLLAFLIIFIVLKLLGWITRHDSYLEVPDVLGKNTKDAIKLLESKGFDVEIQDSVYTDTAKAGIVLKQLPDPNATVKINRTVFITVNRLIPPMIDMPKLEGQSLGFALDLIRRNHLQLGDTIFKPDFQAGMVLEQQYNGVRIPEKAKVQWGSRISLIIGSGLDNQQFIVPDLLGMTFGEAKSYLESMGISVASAIPEPDVKDTASAYIYKQNPQRFDEEKKPIYIKAGQVMDLWLSKVPKVLKDSLNN
ncbi:MAG: PASTA domain-containing protein [Ferruginibacter sp.]